METKTIKLKKGEYTSFTDEFDTHDIIILSGARGAGKSYPVAKHIGKMLIEDEEAQFVYMRINFDELSTSLTWCKDLDLYKIADYPERVELQRGKPTAGDLLLTGYDGEDKLIYSRIIGKCVSLEKAAQFKSGKYDEYKAIVFEEYIRPKMTPVFEKTYVFNFLENVVSIFRDRPKKIFLLCNNLKSLPLLDNAIEEFTNSDDPELCFKSPLKIKIFRETNNKTNSFLAYLNGELYDDEDFKVNVSEFITIYTNKNYIIKQHKIYTNKHYIMANKNKTRITYHETHYLTLKYFCMRSANNEFYYQSKAIEKSFSLEYQSLLAEIAKFVSDLGTQFIVKL